MAIRNFNTESSNGYFQDKSSIEEKVIENVTSQFGLQQAITELRYILDSPPSFNNLIFTSQPDLMILKELVHIDVKIIIIRYFLQNLAEK